MMFFKILFIPSFYFTSRVLNQLKMENRLLKNTDNTTSVEEEIDNSFMKFLYSTYKIICNTNIIYDVHLKKFIVNYENHTYTYNKK
jgi:hypothetical protein